MWRGIRSGSMPAGKPPGVSGADAGDIAGEAIGSDPIREGPSAGSAPAAADARNEAVIGFLLEIQERFGEIRGTALANGITLQTFLSVFPLLLVAIAVIGFLSAGDPNFTTDLIDNLGLDAGGDGAEQITDAIANAEDSRRASSVIGVAGLLLSGLNLVTAVQRSVDAAWQGFGKGLLEKVRALLWLLGAVVIFVASFAVTSALNFVDDIAESVPLVDRVPWLFTLAAIAVGLAVNVALFLWTFWFLNRQPVGWRASLPGALFCAFGFELLKIIGSVYVPRLVANSQALYGSLGIIFALLAWLAFFGRLLVYGSVVNVIRWERLHGTVRIPIDAPRVDHALALSVNRSGAVVDRLGDDDADEHPDGHPADNPGDNPDA